jgi:hypothetical protein
MISGATPKANAQAATKDQKAIAICLGMPIQRRVGSEFQRPRNQALFS